MRSLAERGTPLHWRFDTDEPDRPDAQRSLDTLLSTLGEPAREVPHAVVLHNDPLNGVDFVVRALMQVFGYGAGKAAWLMLKAHVTGKARVFTGTQREAQAKCDALVALGPDPQMVARGARALRATVERSD